MRETSGRTLTAHVAQTLVYDQLPMSERDRPFRAGRLAVSAIEAPSFPPQQLLGGCYAFRVLAPWAAQRAALEEDRRANTGTVMDGISLDVENPTLWLHERSLPGDTAAMPKLLFASVLETHVKSGLR